MLSKREFEGLRAAFENDFNNEAFVNAKNDLEMSEMICENRVTAIGKKALENYRVDNALILAAGMSTRFIPVSYEKPKGLISVKGEVLIERLIHQLLEAGINEIVIVVGYMMDKFLYLRDKYPVKFVVNDEFAVKNTHSSVYAAREHLKNTYIICSDNYYPENPFHLYEYKAFYCSVFLPGISYVERAFTYDENDLIIDTNKPSHDQWIMYGHAYYDRDFSSKFVPILESYYGRPGVENMYWENVYAENLNQLPMYIKRCRDGEILEFDSMEELKAFDSEFISHNNIRIFKNICNALNCNIADIQDIMQITKGLNNRSFKFSCKGKEYIYRHPGCNAENIIDRNQEAKSLYIAKELGIDSTLIHINVKDGWKISRFIQTTENFNFTNFKHISLLAEKLKVLHTSNIKTDHIFDYVAEADKLIQLVRKKDYSSYESMVSTREKMLPIIELLNKDKWQVSLCHNDIYEPNLLVCGDKLDLIDWEFAGDTDIGFDICKLFTFNIPTYEEVDKYLIDYYGRKTTDDEKLHLFACAAMIYYYWFIWSIYASQNGTQVSEYMMSWYDKMHFFANQVIERI